MRVIEADKVIPLVRLLLLFHPNAERILEDMQAVVDSHTIEAEPVRHGRWKSVGLSSLKCSRCGYVDDYKMHYKGCPECRAKMDGEQNG